jgi:hypothetical protein
VPQNEGHVHSLGPPANHCRQTWNAVDLERKLEAFKDYYNHNRFHASLDGDPWG